MVTNLRRPLLVDSHVHFWHYIPADYPWIDRLSPALQNDWLPAQLAPTLDEHSVGTVIAIQARPLESENQWLINLARQYPWIRAIIGWVDLEAPFALDSMDQWCAEGPVRGFRPMLQDAEDPAAVCTGAVFNDNVCGLQDRGLVFELLLHSSQMGCAAAFCSHHDRGTIILDHVGKPVVDGNQTSASFESWRHHMAELGALPHVFVKLSGLMTEVSASAIVSHKRYWPYLDTALEYFGPSRMLFGSDWPVCLSAGSYNEFVQIVEEWMQDRLSATESPLVWGLNATGVYSVAVA